MKPEDVHRSKTIMDRIEELDRTRAEFVRKIVNGYEPHIGRCVPQYQQDVVKSMEAALDNAIDKIRENYLVDLKTLGVDTSDMEQQSEVMRSRRAESAA